MIFYVAFTAPLFFFLIFLASVLAGRASGAVEDAVSYVPNRSYWIRTLVARGQLRKRDRE